MIRIFLNKQLDYSTYTDFKDFSVAGVDFAAKIKKDHPNISTDNFKAYIDSFYADNASILNERCSELNKAISEKQGVFFDAVKKLFGTDLGGEDYWGYISIFDCNPRYVDTNEFQVFYKRNLDDKVRVVFHEVLHFAFFDYCTRNLLAETQTLDKNGGKLWELSEIINVIVLNLPEFRQINGREEKLYYTSLSKKFEKVNQIWNKNLGLIPFIKASLGILSKFELFLNNI